MSVNSISGRVSTRMQTANMLSALRRSQLDMQRIQAQLSTGDKIQSGSEDPAAAGRILDLAAILARIEQFKSNASSADNMLAAADIALGDAANVLREAHSLALSAADSTLDESGRTGILQQLDSLIDQLARTANRKHLGRYLFDGQAGAGEPFVQFDAGLRYTGSDQPLKVALDQNWTQQTALDGVTVFGGQSGHVGSTIDMNPAVLTTTLLSSLNGADGSGVTPGAIRVSDGINPEVVIDLSSSATVGDVIDKFNAYAPPGMTMSIAPEEDRLSVQSSQPGAAVTIADANDGSCAANLGIVADGTAAGLTGLPVDARLLASTPLNQLNGISSASLRGLVLVNGNRTAAINVASARTIGDLINMVGAANVGAKAAISADGRSVELFNMVSGTMLKVGGGPTATQLGWRTFHNDTLLSSLNGGAGIGRASENMPDFRITQRDGTIIDVSLIDCHTVGDVLNAINLSPENTGNLVASIAGSGGIQLRDSSVGTNDFVVAALNSSTAASDLGLAQTAVTDTITGTDTSGAWTDGPIDHLIRLRQAVAGGDCNAILRLGSLIESDLERLIAIRGHVGNQANDLADQTDLLTGRSLDTEAVLSQVRDVDMTEAAVMFQQLQTQLTASMLTVGKILDLNLLDFIR